MPRSFANARYELMHGTGHLGVLTQPDRFADHRQRVRPCPRFLISPARPDRSRRSSTSRDASRCVRRSCSRIRIRSSAGRCTRRWCIQGAKGLARIGCAVLRFNFRGVGRSAGIVQRRPGESRRLQRRARLHGGALSGCAALWPQDSRSAPGWRSKSGAADDRVTALIGIAPPVATSVSGQQLHVRRHAASAPSRSSSCRARQTRSARSRRCGRSTANCPSRRNWSSSTPPITSSTAKTQEVGRSARGPARRFLRVTSHEGSRSRFGGQDTGRQGAERSAAHDASRRARGDRHPRGARARAGAGSRGDRRRDPRLRDAGGRTGTERRADRGAARRAAGVGRRRSRSTASARPACRRSPSRPSG